MKIPILNREACGYIKLRRLGYSISVIARAFGRSTSVISKRIRKAMDRGILSWNDLRKIPNRTRKLARARQWNMIISWMPRWESWILGEGDRPP